MSIDFQQRDGEFAALVAVTVPFASRTVEGILDDYLFNRSIHNKIKLYVPEGEAGDQAARWARENGHKVERFGPGEEDAILDKVLAAVVIGPSPLVKMARRKLKAVRAVAVTEAAF